MSDYSSSSDFGSNSPDTEDTDDETPQKNFSTSKSSTKLSRGLTDPQLNNSKTMKNSHLLSRNNLPSSNVSLNTMNALQNSTVNLGASNSGLSSWKKFTNAIMKEFSIKSANGGDSSSTSLINNLTDSVRRNKSDNKTTDSLEEAKRNSRTNLKKLSLRNSSLARHSVSSGLDNRAFANANPKSSDGIKSNKSLSKVISSR